MSSAGVYYNEIDLFCAAWLRELMKAKQIPDGEVDTRSIELVQPDDLRGFRQCHFFAGIGGWAYALRLAGWPDRRQVWTGSCPCQPFSGLGPKTGFSDARDLWPVFKRLIGIVHPRIVFGEQVADEGGRVWIARVRSDLETLGYAIAPVHLPAGCVGAPQERERIWFVGVGNAKSQRWYQSVGTVDTPTRGRTTARQSPWSSEIVSGRDGTRRRVKSGLVLLAHGLPRRMDQCRGFGNAIVPQVAQVFIEAYLECCGT